MSHLLREHAPITETGWSVIDDEARDRLKPALAARRLIDFAGPHGWEYSATNLGRTREIAGAPGDGVEALQRRVLAVVEMRAPFSLSRDELLNADRGAEDVDLAPLDAAAMRIATAENRAVFHGWEAAGITGIADTSPHEAVARTASAGRAARPRRSRRSCTRASTARTASRSAARPTRASSRPPSTAATRCSTTCAGSSPDPSCGRPASRARWS
jgi:uncharacterized linocin/CFP29 family protein